jgi:hypothetical protein
MSFFARWIYAVVLLFSVLSATGCNSDKGAAPVQANKPATAALKSAAAAKQASKIAKIVFVGQKQACQCTRTRIDTTWAVLQSTLKDKSDVTVENIQLDVEEEQADRLDMLQSLIVPPGLYFFDENDNLVEMLQGEVKQEQIQSLL